MLRQYQDEFGKGNLAYQLIVCISKSKYGSPWTSKEWSMLFRIIPNCWMIDRKHPNHAWVIA